MVTVGLLEQGTMGNPRLKLWMDRVTWKQHKYESDTWEPCETTYEIRHCTTESNNATARLSQTIKAPNHVNPTGSSCQSLFEENKQQIISFGGKQTRMQAFSQFSKTIPQHSKFPPGRIELLTNFTQFSNVWAIEKELC